MTLFDAFILGAVQGLTEFLPISSSGHLVLVESWLKLPVEDMKSFDIAVHVGTLLAIIVYFKEDIKRLWGAFLAFIFKKGEGQPSVDQNLLGTLILATLPAIFVTLLLEDAIDEQFRNASSVSIMIVLVGILFFIVEWIAKKMSAKKIGLKEGMIIGLAQTMALIPGVSRSGITIAAGLVQGIKREEAARFSFLLGGIAIFSGAGYAVFEVLRGGYLAPEPKIAIIGILTSFAFGLAAVSFLMRYLKRHTLIIFGLYRIVLGGILLLM